MVKQYLVWDLPIRIFHWGFVILLAALWYTSDQDLGLIELHMTLGYVALGFVLFRILWGLFGTRHAKFKHFLPSFYQIRLYIQQTKAKQAVTYAGHNPVGSLMVLAMLLLVLVQAISGLFISDDVFSAGPYNSVVSAELEALFEFIHHNGINLILALSFIHIVAVFYYLTVKKQNLIKPMVSGKKSSEQITPAEGIENSKLLRALLIAFAVAAFVYWLVVINAPVVEEYYY